jgi:ubiquinone/menaquinone biosynthesis C-methylase UbiE
MFRYLFIVDRLVKLAKEIGPVKVLDVGCGDIYIARTLQASSRAKKDAVCAGYTGLDIDDRSLERTRGSLPHSFPIDLVCGDVTNGALEQWPDNTFDLVVCTEVLEHLQPKFVPGVLREFARLAERQWISTPNWTGGTGQLPEDHIKEWDVQELTAAMTDNGLAVKRRIGFFGNLPKMKKWAARDPKLDWLFRTLEPISDPHFLSLVMARVAGPRAQNVMYLCRRA